MNAENYLRGPQLLRQRIFLKMQEYEDLYNLATSISSSLYRDQNAGSDPVGSAAVRMADLSREIDALRDAYSQSLKAVNALLEQLSPQEHMVLHGFYISCRRWAQIAETMQPHPLSERQVYRIRKSGLMHLQQLLDARERADGGFSALEK